MRNILLVGEWNSNNYGDQVICFCVESMLYQYIPSLNLIRFDTTWGLGYNMRKKADFLCHRIWYKLFDNVEKRTKSFQDYRTKWVREDINSFKYDKVELIIFCGGQMFLDYFIYSINEIVKYAVNKNIPILWNACGGGMCSSLSLNLFKNMLRSPVPQILSVRDNLDFFQKDLCEKSYIVPDPAICVPVIEDVIVKQKQNKIGLGIMNPSAFKEVVMTDDELITFWASLIQYLNAQNVKWELFTNGSDEDNAFLHRLKNILNITSEHIAPFPHSGLELINIISSYKKVISFRLHSHIISYALKIPSFGFIWDKKVYDFFCLTENEDSVMPLSSISIDPVVSFIHSSVGNFSKLDVLQNSAKDNLIQNTLNLLD